MGCYRVYAHGRSADVHKVTYELETATQTMKLEPEEQSAHAYGGRLIGYMHNIRSVFRLGDHVCAADPWHENFKSIDELYLDKGDGRGPV